MKKNLYYRTVFKRSNPIKEAILGFFFAFCSWPRLLLEVFLRKNMGERYFSFSNGIIMAVILGWLPFLYSQAMHRFFGSDDSAILFLRFTSWYAFLAGFLYMCYLRQQEIYRLPSVFDFGRFSLTTGDINPQIREFEIGGKKPDVRQIETLVEPGLCGAIGLGLSIIGQPIGLVIFFSSIFYSLSYMEAYRLGDHKIMDMIDEQIFNEEMVSIIVDDKYPSQTRGVNIYGRRPTDPETRRKLIDSFIEEDTIVAL